LNTRVPEIYRRMAACMAAGLVLGTVISEASFYFLGAAQTRSPQVIEIAIPAGTALRVSRGQSNPLLPQTMTFVVGDTLLVRNLDSVTHELGPLLIPAGSSASMRMDSAEDYSAACSFQPSKYIGLRVASPLTLATRLVGIFEAGIPMGLLFLLYGLFAIPGRKPSPA
jgi:hypothetical protein